MEGLASQPSASDEQTQAYNRKWVEWIGSLVQAGTLESGLPLTPTAKVVTRDSVSDLPLKTEDIYAYLLVNAPTPEAVRDIGWLAPPPWLSGQTSIRARNR